MFVDCPVCDVGFVVVADNVPYFRDWEYLLRGGTALKVMFIVHMAFFLLYRDWTLPRLMYEMCLKKYKIWKKLLLPRAIR